HCYGRPRHLHSFPTRRSSDLGMVLDLCCGIGGDLAALGAVVDRVVGVDHDETHAVCARHNAGVYDVHADVVVADVADVRTASAADRKSTRLNSSHLVISYAVF